MCLLEAGGVRSLSLSVEGRENMEGVGEQGCEVRSDSTAEHLHTLSLCVSLLLTLKGVSLGIQSICPHEDALFLSPLCFTHYALYKVFIGLCQTSSAFLRGKKCQHMKRKTLHILLVVFVCVSEMEMTASSTIWLLRILVRRSLMNVLAQSLICLDMQSRRHFSTYVCARAPGSTCVLALRILDNT